MIYNFISGYKCNEDIELNIYHINDIEENSSRILFCHWLYISLICLSCIFYDDVITRVNKNFKVVLVASWDYRCNNCVTVVRISRYIFPLKNDIPQKYYTYIIYCVLEKLIQNCLFHDLSQSVL